MIKLSSVNLERIADVNEIPDIEVMRREELIGSLRERSLEAESHFARIYLDFMVEGLHKQPFVEFKPGVGGVFSLSDVSREVQGCTDRGGIFKHN
jgi:hypothetical protein